MVTIFGLLNDRQDNFHKYCENFERFHRSKLKKIKGKAKISLASASLRGALANNENHSGNRGPHSACSVASLLQEIGITYQARKIWTYDRTTDCTWSYF